MNILVVGGAGYVGGGVTDLLMETDHNVRVYDALLYEESYRKPVDFVLGDVRDHDCLKPQLEWADVVIWLAALVGDPACALNPEVTVDINQQEVKWLADHYDGRIIFPSTCSVYGAQDGILNESSPLNPLSVYAATKREAEKYLASKFAIMFRLGTLFGVGDSYSRIRLDLVLNTLTVRAQRRKAVTVFGGDQYRPLLHVRDAAKTMVENLTTEATGIFNLHYANFRITDLADSLKAHFPDLTINKTPMTFQDARSYRVSSDHAKSIIKFCPVETLDDGIEELKELVASGRLKDPDNPRYSNQGFLSLHRTHLGGAVS